MSSHQDQQGLCVRGQIVRGAAQVRVDVEIGPGEVLAVVGPNGAGKSTLLHAVAGLVALDEGMITCGGVTWQEGPRVVSSELRDCGVLFQDLRLFPSMTVLSNVAFGCRCRGASRSEAQARARDVLAEVGAGHLADRSPNQLSGGERQRVALARALAPRPRVLLLDEPFVSVDTPSRSALREVVGRAVSSFSGSVLVVSHDHADVEHLATKFLSL